MNLDKAELRLMWLALNDRADFEARQAKSRQLRGAYFIDARKRHRDERMRYLALRERVAAELDHKVDFL